MVRVARTLPQKFAYSSIHECKRCRERRVDRRKLRIALHSSSRCPHCGSERLTIFKKRDRIDRLYKSPLSLLQGLLGASLYHCPVCRLQFYDLRDPSQAALLMQRANGPAATSGITRDASPKPPNSLNTTGPRAGMRPPLAPLRPEPPRAAAVLGAAIKIIGHVQSNEDLCLEGELEGSVDLAGCRFTIGKHGKALAIVKAREVVVLGIFHGNLQAAESVMVANGAELTGDIHAAFVRIEDGANVRGNIDILKQPTANCATALTGRADPPAVVS